MSEESISYNKALSYTHRLFHFRPRSENELTQRLKQRGFGDTTIEKVITGYKQKHLLDDKRFAKLWTLSRMQAKPSSLKKIKHELVLKGVDKETIDETLNNAKEGFDEYEIARNLAEKRKRILAGVDKLKAKKRIFDYLNRRGFSGDVIFKALNEIYENDS